MNNQFQYGFSEEVKSTIDTSLDIFLKDFSDLNKDSLALFPSKYVKSAISTIDCVYSLDDFEKILDGKGGENYWKYEDRLKELNRISKNGFSNCEINSIKGLEKLLDIKIKLNSFENKIEKKYVLKVDEKNSIFQKKIKNGSINKYLNTVSELDLLKSSINTQIVNIKDKYHIRESSEIVDNLIDILYSRDSNSWTKITDRIEIIQDSIDDLNYSNRVDYNVIASLSRLSEEIEISRNKNFKKYSNQFGILKENIDNLILDRSKEFGVEENRLTSKILPIDKFNEEVFLQKKVEENFNKLSDNYNVVYGFLFRHFNYGSNRSKYINDETYNSQLGNIHDFIDFEFNEMTTKLNVNSKLLQKNAGVVYLNYLNNSFFNDNSYNVKNNENYSVKEFGTKIRKINLKDNSLGEFKNSLYKFSKINWLNNDLINLYDNISSNSIFYRSEISKDLTSLKNMHKFLSSTFKNSTQNFRKEGVNFFGNEFKKVLSNVLDVRITKEDLTNRFLCLKGDFFNETHLDLDITDF